MQYYCCFCKVTITEGEYKYSKDVFGKALCRKHQDMERTSTSPQNNLFSKSTQEIPQQTTIEKIKETTSQKFGRLLKKTVVVTGKGIVKGVKTIVDVPAKKI